MENFKIILPYLKRYKKDVVCAIIAIRYLLPIWIIFSTQ